MEYNLVIKKECGIYNMKCVSERLDKKHTKALKNQVSFRYTIEKNKINIIDGYYTVRKDRYDITLEALDEFFPGLYNQLIEESKYVKNNEDYIEIAKDLCYPASVAREIELADSEFKINMILRTAREAM